jgi:hypothetical protein
VAVVTAPVAFETETFVGSPQTFSSPAASVPPSNLWYYCTEPAGYYPYTQTCNRAWIPVTPPASEQPQ